MKLSRRTFSQLGAAAAAGSSAWAKALGRIDDAVPAARGQLTVDMAEASVPFNRMIFGQFLEHFHRQVYGGVFEPGSSLSDSQGFRLDVVEALRELKVPIVRWPGGCFVSAYHWREGVGKNREPSFNKAWGVEEPNTFGTDEFVKWCRMIGAEPYICTNAGTGTEEEMSDWVEYCNLPSAGRNARMRIANGSREPFNVRYWSIGNENYLGGEIGSKTVEEWGPLVRESAKMMHSVDSNIKILAAATVSGNWTPPLLQAAGKYIDYISIHGYWDHLWARGTHPSDFQHCMSFSEAPEQQIRKAITLLEDTGFSGRIGIAFDEWNLRGWHHPGFPGGGANNLDMIRERDENDRNETYTMADAIFSACFLNGCLRNARHVQMACMAPVVNVRGPLYVHPKGIVKRTTFHVLRMYSDLLQPNVLATTVLSDHLQVDKTRFPSLDGIATSSADGKKVSVALVNRDATRQAAWKLDISGFHPAPVAELTLLSGDSPDAFNDVANPNRVKPETRRIHVNEDLILPPHSVCTAQYHA